MALAAVGEAPIANSESQGKNAALTVFSEIQVGRSIRPTGQEKLHLHEEPSEVHTSKRPLIVVGHGTYGLQKTSL